MAQAVALEVNVNGANAEKSILAIKKELQNANKEIKTAADEFGVYSQQVLDAEQKVAVLKNQLSKAANESRKLTASDKLAAFNSTLNTVAGGFSAVIGAQALLGAESEDVQKQLARVQAAMSFAQGIESITAASGGFKKLAILIKTNVVGAFSSMKAAIASTGIGLLVIGIGLLIEKFVSMGNAAEEAADKQDKLNESTKRFADIGLKANLAALERTNKINIEKAKLAGKSEQEIFDIEQDYRSRKKSIYEGYHKEVKDSNVDAANDTKAIIDDLNAETEVKELENQIRIKKIQQDAAKEKLDKLKENSKKEKEAIQQANEKAAQEIKSLEDEIALLRIKDEDERAKAKLKQDYDNKIKEIEQSKANEGLKNKELLALKKKFELDSNILDNEIKDKKLKADLEKQTQIDKAITDARLAAITDENFKKQSLIDIQRDDEIQKQTDAYNNGLINLDQYNAAVAGINKEFDKQQIDLKKQIADEQVKIAEEQKNKELAILEEKQKKELEIAKSVSDGINFYKSLIELNSQEVTNQQKKDNDIQKELLDSNQISKEQYEANIAAINEKADKKKRQLQRQSIIAENAMTIANIILNTLQANAKAAAQFPLTLGQPWVGFNTAQGILGVATTIAQTAKALSALGGGGATGGGIANFGNKTGVPLSPQVQTTNLNQNQINQLSSATARAFVLESDVSGSQERIQRINRAARIN